MEYLANTIFPGFIPEYSALRAWAFHCSERENYGNLRLAVILLGDA